MSLNPSDIETSRNAEILEAYPGAGRGVETSKRGHAS